jgi:hypothetical protein
MSVELTSIKVWAEASANTLMLEATQGIYDAGTGLLTIPHPVFKQIKQKSMDDRTLPNPSNQFLTVYVDAAQKVAAAAAGGRQLPATPLLRRQKMHMKSMELKEATGRGVKLTKA